MEDCIFCRIAKKEIPAEFVYEDGEIMAFPDIHPAASPHLLIVPEGHIEDLMSSQVTDGKIWEKMTEVAKKLIEKNNLKSYRLVLNGGEAKLINHLHLHLLGEVSSQRGL